MSPNRRIVLNVISTYGRSLYALAVGLVTARWALQALGQIDYGLMGLIGGLTAFISFINSRFAGSIGRFYALSVGRQRVSLRAGLEDCRMWFTTAVMIHLLIPVLLMLIGYPVGEWAVRHFLTIPSDRVEASVWVFRFVCCTCFLGMISVPLQAMYVAKQYIAELTIYSFVTTTLNAFFLYYMVTHPGVWLTRFAFWNMLLGLAPSLIISIRAYFIFPECRFLRKYINCWPNIKKLGNYITWTTLGALGSMLQGQGVAILINKYFGPRVNAGAAVGNSISGHCQMLSGSMIGAFSPAIYNSWGAGQYDLARALAYRVCKFGTLLTLVFALPLMLEIDEVLILWLREPPPHAALMCIFVLTTSIIDQTANGHMMCVLANGKIAAYHIVLGGSLLLTIPIAWVLLQFDFGIASVGIALISMMVICAWGRVWFARKLAGLSSRYWLAHVFLPLAILTATSLAIGYLPRLILKQCFARVCITTAAIELWMLPMAWMLVLNREEREFVSAKLWVLITSRIRMLRS